MEIMVLVNMRTCTLVLPGKICNITIILVIYHQFNFLACPYLYSNLCMRVKLPLPDKVRHMLINTWNYLTHTWLANQKVCIN